MTVHDPDYWYHNRDRLECEQIFRTRCDGIVRLDHRKPGDGTQWVVAEWGGKRFEHDTGWGYYESTIEPGDLAEQLPDDWDKNQPLETR